MILTEEINLAQRTTWLIGVTCEILTREVMVIVINKLPQLPPVHYSFPTQTTNEQNLARVKRQPSLCFVSFWIYG